MMAPAGDGLWVHSADGVPIRFEIHGRGEPTLLFVHGWAFDRHLWQDQVRRLAPRHRVITLDLAAHGESGRRRTHWTLPAFGQDVKAVANVAASTGLVLIGHSMGGPVVLEAARLMPQRVRGVVLVDALHDVGERASPEHVAEMVRRLEADFGATLRQFVDEFLLAPTSRPAVRELVTRQVTALPPEISIALLREVWSYDPLPALKAIQAPVRAVNADRFTTNVEGNRRYAWGYEAAIVRGTGHYPMLEAPAAFAEALNGVLDGLAAAVS